MKASALVAEPLKKTSGIDEKNNDDAHYDATYLRCDAPSETAIAAPVKQPRPNNSDATAGESCIGI